MMPYPFHSFLPLSLQQHQTPKCAQSVYTASTASVRIFLAARSMPAKLEHGTIDDYIAWIPRN